MLGNNGPLVNDIIKRWADEQFNKVMLNSRRPTGLKDKDGKPVFEGDILHVVMPGFKKVYAAVKWDSASAAYVLEGQLPDGNLWHTENLKGVNEAQIAGNIFNSASLLTRCEAA